MQFAANIQKRLLQFHPLNFQRHWEMQNVFTRRCEKADQLKILLHSIIKRTDDNSLMGKADNMTVWEMPNYIVFRIIIITSANNNILEPVNIGCLSPQSENLTKLLTKKKMTVLPWGVFGLPTWTMIIMCLYGFFLHSFFTLCSICFSPCFLLLHITILLARQQHD